MSDSVSDILIGCLKIVRVPDNLSGIRPGRIVLEALWAEKENLPKNYGHPSFLIPALCLC